VRGLSMTKMVVAPEKVRFICDQCKWHTTDKDPFMPITVVFGFGSIHDTERKDFCSDECARAWFAKDEETHDPGLLCPCRDDPCESEGCDGEVKTYLDGGWECKSFVATHGKKDFKEWSEYVRRERRVS